jgi:hypothetical protein
MVTQSVLSLPFLYVYLISPIVGFSDGPVPPHQPWPPSSNSVLRPDLHLAVSSTVVPGLLPNNQLQLTLPSGDGEQHLCTSPNPCSDKDPDDLSAKRWLMLLKAVLPYSVSYLRLHLFPSHHSFIQVFIDHLPLTCQYSGKHFRMSPCTDISCLLGVNLGMTWLGNITDAVSCLTLFCLFVLFIGQDLKPGWPQTHDPYVLVSQVLRLQVCATISDSCLNLEA